MSKTLNKEKFKKLTLENRAELEKESRLKLCDEAWEDLEKCINAYGMGKTNYPFEPLSLNEKNCILEIKQACKTICVELDNLAENYPLLFKSLFKRYNCLDAIDPKKDKKASIDDIIRLLQNCKKVLQLHGTKKRGQGPSVTQKSINFLKEIIYIYYMSLDMDPRPPGHFGGPSFDKYYGYIRSLLPNDLKVTIPNTGRAAKKRAGFK